MKQGKRLTYKLFIFFIFLNLIFVPDAIFAQDGTELIVHFVEGDPFIDKVGYEVSIFLSALNADGSAISGLNKDNFKISEDSQQVEIEELAVSSNLPMSLILLIDSSGSMQGTPIQNARQAASNFIGGLSDTDQLALATFNEEITYLSEFEDKNESAKGKLSSVDAVNLASTCLYDAAFSAVQKAATLESGRRAIILLTDGQDYKSGGACSIHTLDDVVGLSSEGSTRVPIFTIGLGDEIDEKSLQRLSDMSGGTYQFAPSSSNLQKTFDTLSSQLRSQYILTYTSSAAPGSHTIAVEMRYEQQTILDTRNFTLPERPIVLTLVSPNDGQEISGSVKMAVTISGAGETVEKILFSLGDEVIASDTTTPYDLEYNFSEEQVGSHILTAAALNAAGEVVAQQSVGISVLEGAKAAKSAKTPFIDRLLGNPYYVGLAIFGVAFLITAIVMIMRRKKKNEPVFSDEFVLREESHPVDEHTIDISLLGTEVNKVAPSKSLAEALAVLTVINSDDTGMIGQQLSITQFPTTVGRSAKNDIVISKKDQPVSRDHIIIAQRRGVIVLSEVMSTDANANPKPPTYGTFVNEKKVSGESIQLNDGDEIRLGSRFRMKFEFGIKNGGSEDRTMDGIDLKNEGMTREITRDEGLTQESDKE